MSQNGGSAAALLRRLGNSLIVICLIQREVIIVNFVN